MKKLFGSLVVGSALLLGACGNEEQVNTEVDDPNVPWWEEEGGQEKLEEVPYEENGATVEIYEEEWVDPNVKQAREHMTSTNNEYGTGIYVED